MPLCSAAPLFESLCSLPAAQHAYYLDVQNKRPEYISTFVNELINWDKVGHAAGPLRCLHMLIAVSVFNRMRAALLVKLCLHHCAGGRALLRCQVGSQLTDDMWGTTRRELISKL